jgi:hypothetical protein
LVVRTLLPTIALALALVGCRKPPPTGQADAGPPPSDHLAAGEIAEGHDKAFALPLPRASTIAMRFPGTIHVTSSLAPEQLSNFIRPRVKSGKMVVGATMTTFEDVIVPAEPTRHMTIEIRPGAPMSGTKSQMVVKDVTPAPAPDPNESQAERRRKAGLTPDGKLIDPQHMQ